MKWISVKDNLPKHNEIILIYIPNCEISITIAAYHKCFYDLTNQGCSTCTCQCKECLSPPEELNVSHWMSLPFPPKEKFRSIQAHLKLKILKKYNFKCNNCKNSPALDDKTELQIDHIIPFSKGGRHNADNLQILCRACNYKKGTEINNGR